jgi:hypothetical protein
MKVKLWDVGNGKWSGDVAVPPGRDPEAVMLKEARKHLASRAIDVDPPDGDAPGCLLVGGFRVVGYFKYEV